MTIEGLERLAAFLYREAEQDSPIIGHVERQEWMARQIENAIEDNDVSLTDLLACDTDEQVIDLLEERYRGFSERNGENDEEGYDYLPDAYQ